MSKVAWTHNIPRGVTSALSAKSAEYVPLSERGKKKKGSSLVILTRPQFLEVRRKDDRETTNVIASKKKVPLSEMEVRRKEERKTTNIITSKKKEKKRRGKKKTKFRFELVSGMNPVVDDVRKEQDKNPVHRKDQSAEKVEISRREESEPSKKRVDVYKITKMHSNRPSILQRYLIHVDGNMNERRLRKAIMFCARKVKPSSLALFARLFERHVRECRDSKDGNTPIHAAAGNQDGGLECCRILLNAGVPVFRKNNKGETALHIASQNNAKDILEFLLSKRKYSENLINVRDRTGRTALHHAVIRRHLKCVSMLCRAGAKPSLRDVNDEDALTLSVVSGSVRIARVLLEIGFWKNEEEYFHSLTNAMCRVLTSPSFRVSFARLLVRSGADSFASVSKCVKNEIAVERFLSLGIVYVNSKMERVVGLAQRFNAYKSVSMLLSHMPRCSTQLRSSLQNDWNRRLDLQFIYDFHLRSHMLLLWIPRHRVHIELCRAVLVTQAENVRCFSLLRLRVASFLWDKSFWKAWTRRMRRAGFIYYV